MNNFLFNLKVARILYRKLFLIFILTIGCTTVKVHIYKTTSAKKIDRTVFLLSPMANFTKGYQIIRVGTASPTYVAKFYFNKFDLASLDSSLFLSLDLSNIFSETKRMSDELHDFSLRKSNVVLTDSLTGNKNYKTGLPGPIDSLKIDNIEIFKKCNRCLFVYPYLIYTTIDRGAISITADCGFVLQIADSQTGDIKIFYKKFETKGIFVDSAKDELVKQITKYTIETLVNNYN